VCCLLPCWHAQVLGVPACFLRQVPFVPWLPTNRRQGSCCMALIGHCLAACHPGSMAGIHCHACPGQGQGCAWRCRFLTIFCQVPGPGPLRCHDPRKHGSRSSTAYFRTCPHPDQSGYCDPWRRNILSSNISIKPSSCCDRGRPSSPRITFARTSWRKRYRDPWRRDTSQPLISTTPPPVTPSANISPSCCDPG